LDDLPANVVGEIIDGRLYVGPRPRPRHSNVIASVIESLRPPFQRGVAGPGGWWIMPEPGIELPDSPEIVLDVAGWRRARLASLPDGPFDLIPDWVCEVHSPGNRSYDLRIKRPYYARVGVPYMWMADVESQTLTVSRNQGGRWLDLGTFGGDDKVRVEPFDAVEIALADWWAAIPS
jgi:Uma2 family endonuclease